MTPTRLGIRTPVGGDSPDLPRDFSNANADIDTLIARTFAPPLQEGVVNAGDLKVTLSAGMVLSIAAGMCAVQDDAVAIPMELVPIVKLTASTITIATANGTNPRIDQIVIDKTGLISSIAGTATAGATLSNRTGAAALPASSFRLADVLVPTSAGSILAGNINDRRPWARGAFRRLIRPGGALGFAGGAFAQLDAANWAPPIECSGAPLRIGIRSKTISAGGQNTEFGPLVDGALIDGMAGGAIAFTVNFPAAGVNPAAFDWETLPTAGKHTIGWGMSTSAAGNTLQSGNAIGPLLIVEEIVRQNADNT